MSKRIVVASQKGGVGKTTVCLNLGLAFAEKGRRTLIVDLDPQGQIGHSLGRDDAQWKGIADLMMGEADYSDVIIRTKVEALSILPRGRLDPVDICEFEQALHEPGVLANVLDPLNSHYDRVLIDTPSGLGMITRSALRISDFVLIPFQAEPLAFQSMPQLLRLIDEIRKGENQRLHLLGFLATMVDKKNEFSKAALLKMWTDFSHVLLDSTIPRSSLYTKASSLGVPAKYLKGVKGAEAQRFDLLALELEVLISLVSPGEEEEDSDAVQRQLL